MPIFIDNHHEGCMNNDFVLANCLTWINSGTTFIISTPNVQLFAELLGSLTWVLFAACSLEYYIFVMLCPYLVLMLFVFHNVSSWASCVSWRCTASKSSVGWVCRHLLPLNVYQHLFCVPLQSEPNLGILPSQANTWPRDLQSSGKPLNFTVIGRWRTWRPSTRCDAERNYEVWVLVYNASGSNLILSRTLRNLSIISCWIRYFSSTNMAGVSVDDNIRHQMPKLRWLMTENGAVSLWW